MSRRTARYLADGTVAPPRMAPWCYRFVPWVQSRGVWHVVTHLAPVGRGIVSTLACGCAGGAVLLCTSSYFHQRWYGYDLPTTGEPIPRRICRECAARLKAAGECGRIVPAEPR